MAVESWDHGHATNDDADGVLSKPAEATFVNLTVMPGTGGNSRK